jgi:hypothetical protein
MIQSNKFVHTTVILDVIGTVHGATYTISLEVPTWRLLIDGSFWKMGLGLHKVTHPSLDKCLRRVG